MALDTSLLVRLAATLSSALDLTSPKAELGPYSKTIALATGTGANQADKIFSDQRTLSASATENLDLAGVLADALGATITFARVKLILIYADPANTNNVIVGGAASNGFINWVGDPTDTIIVRPGGLLLLVAPDATAYVVTASTGDILKVANSSSGTGVTYDVIIVGSSA